VSMKRNQDVGNREDGKQGDREGRHYPVTKKRLAEGIYSRGDPRGRPEMLEQDLAHRWRALPLVQSLPLVSGDTCLLCYAGRSGGPQGPDIRDAVLQFASEKADEAAARVTGDVEFHIRAFRRNRFF
jgi:hypothetical protein